MASDADINEIKRMCAVLFLELQEMRRRLEIEPVGSRDMDAYQAAIPGDLAQFERKMRDLANKR